MDFSKFDKQINGEQLQQDIKAAAENNTTFDPTPKGTYTVKIEKLEIGETGPQSAGGAGRPMLKAMFRILEGDQKKRTLFVNRVLYGTKNDANMIANAISFLESLDSGLDIGFETYSQFAELVLDVFEEIESTLEYEVEYDPDAFNTVSIKEVFEV